MIEFRKAADGDWNAILRIFRSVTSSEDTYPYPAGMSEEEILQTWMMPPREVYVACELDEVVGTAYVKPNTPGLGDHIANAGWMIDPVHQGRGIGRPFAEYVITQARGQGFRAMQFNGVVATNTTAIALWESLGFQTIGTVPEAFRHRDAGLTAVHIMYRKL